MGLLFNKKNQKNSFGSDEIREYIKNDFYNSKTPGKTSKVLIESCTTEGLYNELHEMIYHGDEDSYSCAFDFIEFLYAARSSIPGQAGEKLYDYFCSHDFMNETFSYAMSIEKYIIAFDVLPYTTWDKNTIKDFFIKYSSENPALSYNFFQRYTELNDNTFDKELYDSISCSNENLFFLKVLLSILPQADEFNTLEMLKALEPFCPSYYKEQFEQDINWQKKYSEGEGFENLFSFAVTVLTEITAVMICENAEDENRDFISEIKKALEPENLNKILNQE